MLQFMGTKDLIDLCPVLSAPKPFVYILRDRSLFMAGGDGGKSGGGAPKIF